MRYLKMLGLAAIMAIGSMAFVGVSTASATTLFTDIGQTTTYGAGTSISASLKTGSTSKLTGFGGETLATCASSLFSGTTNSSTGTRVGGFISSLTWSACSQTVDTIWNGSFDIEWSSGLNGAVTGSGIEFTVALFGVSCTYGTGAATKLGTISSGLTPILSINAINLPKTAGGFLCPSTVGWDVEYVVTSPHALFVGA